MTSDRKKTLNIIIADDDSDMLFLLAQTARACGAKIAYSATAVEDIMKDGSIDYSKINAAIVDYEFKGSEHNGIDLIRYLKSMGVPAVHLCTGFYADKDIRREAKQAGATSILKKPLDDNEIAKIL